jgi:hypothetical protein
MEVAWMRLNARAGLLVPLLLAAGLTGSAQDLSTFLSKPPAQGSWASYRIETSWPGRTKTEHFNLAITGSEMVDGQSRLWIEAWPTDFARHKDGVMRLLLKASPSPEEALNPFLQASALCYQEPEHDAFKLSDGALSFMHGQARKIKVDQKKTALSQEQAMSTEGVVFECERVQISTTTESSLFGRSVKITETGTYWFSEESPFGLVKAQIERVQIQTGKEDRHRTVVVTLREGGSTGAASQFSTPVTKEKGLLGLLFN